MTRAMRLYIQGAAQTAKRAGQSEAEAFGPGGLCAFVEADIRAMAMEEFRRFRPLTKLPPREPTRPVNTHCHVHDETRRIEHDARGIALGYVCDRCAEEFRSKFRPDVFTDPDYWHDEPIGEDW